MRRLKSGPTIYPFEEERGRRRRGRQVIVRWVKEIEQTSTSGAGVYSRHMIRPFTSSNTSSAQTCLMN
ncbi:unnamed protein product [Allacma fusca]|uniref:Uncharacterized protein n=1 Tax=Allacma fusca TaxID=39272 RepID=A0A8J2KXV2_9HEXA|nr:unnamed protein product [Allacma fusca]